jgi:hypothetical protein
VTFREQAKGSGPEQGDGERREALPNGFAHSKRCSMSAMVE